MNKRNHYVLALTCAILIGGGVAYALLRPPAPTAPASGGVVTKTGQIICLKPADESGVHTLMCALGVEEPGGVAYGLGSDDPTLIGSVPTGSRVKVTGELKPAGDSRYKSSGTIQVTTLVRL